MKGLLKERGHTFLPETALRRTLSSLPRPKNWMKWTRKWSKWVKVGKNCNNKSWCTRQTLESCTGLLLLSSCSFYIWLPFPGKIQPETTSRQVNQAPSRQVTDPSSNFKEPIHKEEEDIISPSDIEKQKLYLTPNNIMILMCTIKHQGGFVQSKGCTHMQNNIY